MTDHRHSFQIHGDNHGKLITSNRYFIYFKTRNLFWIIVIAVLFILLATALCVLSFRSFLPEKSNRQTIPVAERVIYEGSRGGKYYINAGGHKVYVPRDTPVTEPPEKRTP